MPATRSRRGPRVLTASGIDAADDAFSVMSWITPARSFPERVTPGLIAAGFTFHVSIRERSCCVQPGNERAQAG